MADFVAFLLRHPVGFLTAIGVLAFDQMAKLLVVRTLAVGESWPMDGVIRLTHVTNSGSAFHLFNAPIILIFAASAIGIGVLFVLYSSRPNTGIRSQLSFGLMVAGVLGNLVDRLVLGHVTDFIDMFPWFIFNVADASIGIGLVFFVWDVQAEMSRSLTRLRWRS